MKCILFITLLVYTITLCHGAAIKENKENSSEEEEYDQRQSGSENYRINVDGVVIAIAPADEVLSAVSNFELSDVIELTDDSLSSQIHKQTSKPVITLLSSSKPNTSQTSAERKSSNDRTSSNNRLGQSIINIIKPFLRRAHKPQL